MAKEKSLLRETLNLIDKLEESGVANPAFLESARQDREDARKILEIADRHEDDDDVDVDSMTEDIKFMLDMIRRRQGKKDSKDNGGGD